MWMTISEIQMPGDLYHLPILPRDFQTHPKFNSWAPGGVFLQVIFKGNFWESQNSLGWKGHQKPVWYSLSWEREPRWDCLASCSFAAWKLPVVGVLPHGEAVPIIDWGKSFTMEDFFLSHTETCSNNWHSLPLLFVAPWEGRPSALFVTMLQKLKFCGEVLPWTFSFPGRKDLTPSAFTQIFQPFDHQMYHFRITVTIQLKHSLFWVKSCLLLLHNKSNIYLFCVKLDFCIIHCPSGNSFLNTAVRTWNISDYRLRYKVYDWLLLVVGPTDFARTWTVINITNCPIKQSCNRAQGEKSRKWQHV